MDKGFREYRRKGMAIARPVTEVDIYSYTSSGHLITEEGTIVSISAVDKAAGSPKIGDMIAKNPKDEDDQWLIAEAYFLDNFEV